MNGQGEMTTRLEMFLGMVNSTGELPSVPETVYPRLESKLRGTDATMAHSAACVLWLSWPGHRGKFWNFYMRNFDSATTFLRLIGKPPASEDEARSLLLLWTLFDALSHISESDSLPYEAYALAQNLDSLLAEWPAAELQRRRAQIDAHMKRSTERLMAQA